MNPEISSMAAIIAQEFALETNQVNAIIELLLKGYEVAFIYRYRKSCLQHLTFQQLQQLEARFVYLQALNHRKQAIITAIKEQGKFTETLAKTIEEADSKARLEDIYLPFRPQKTNKNEPVVNQKLKDFAQKIFITPDIDLTTEIVNYLEIDSSFQDKNEVVQALEQHLIEIIAEDLSALDHLREYLWQQGILKSTGEKQQKGSHKFSDYLNFSQTINKVPFHKILALFRGRREGILKLTIILEDGSYPENYLKQRLEASFNNASLTELIKACISKVWHTRWYPKLQLELFNRLKELADGQAIALWSRQLETLLLTPAAGGKVVLGLDTNNRVAIKAAVIDAHGHLQDYATLLMLSPDGSWQDAVSQLAKLILEYRIELVGIGNGSAAREIEHLVADVIKTYPDLNVKKTVINQTGAQAYAATKEGAQEYPEVEAGIKSALSIARRVQNPLSELVKITPSLINMSLYQTDVNQTRLTASFKAAISKIVNNVGVEVNTASEALLSYVCGLNKGLAKNLVEYRAQLGGFTNRAQLTTVPGWQAINSQQALGFLKIFNSDNPLDATAVHPEDYALVQKIADDQKVSLKDLLLNPAVLAKINLENYTSESSLMPVEELIQELQSPSVDPRLKFRPIEFTSGIATIADLKLGMKLQGVVTNITAFGVFINIGVYQDGLLHLSVLKSYPKSKLKPGRIIQVKVIEIDRKNNRIGLDIEKNNYSQAKQKPVRPMQTKKKSFKNPNANKMTPSKNLNAPVFNTVMAEALMKLTSNKN